MDSDPSVSQSTQLLQHALEPNPQSQEHRRDRGPASPNDGDTKIDFSLDSRIIANPERSGEPAQAEDFRKEKHRQVDGEQVGTCYTASPAWSKNNVESVELGSGSELFRQHGDSPVTASAGKVVETVSFQSPSTTAGVHPLSQSTGSMPFSTRYYRRSPSLPSQDSFGGPVSQDPAELYLASSKPFNVPLSHLGETPTQAVVHSPTDPGMTLPDASEHKEFLEAAMRDYEAQKANRATSSRRTNVLVVATPSNSDESLGMSQHTDNDFSFPNHGPEFTGQELRFGFNGSSSFDKMLDRDLADAPDLTPEPTQPEEIDPTQDDGIIDTGSTTGDDIPTTPPRSNKQRSSPFEWTAPAPSAAVASSNPRSLLRMVHPGNQYRIARMRNLAGAVEPPSCVTIGTETQPSEETQSDPSVLPSAQPAPRQTKVTGSLQMVHQHRKGDEDDEPEDELDVVPDSEPLRAGPSTQTPASQRTVQGASSKKPFRPCSPMSEHGSGELVPDSLEVEESEADIPLAIEVASRNTKKSVAPTEGVSVHNGKTRTASAVPERAPLPALEERSGKPIPSSTKERNSRVKPSKIEPTEVPTSLPEQDLHVQASSFEQLPVASTNLLPSKKKRRRSHNLEPLRARHTSTCPSTTKPIVGKKRFHKSDTESSEDLSCHPAEDEGAMHPKVQKEDEEAESGNGHDVDSPPPPPPKSDTSRKKRRRIEDANPTRGTSKASTSTRNKQSETPGVATRSVKRLRSGLSSTRGFTAEPATRIFALWKQDGHYYSGAIHSREPKNKYLVKFDDGTEDEVELKNMRRRDLQVGDRVITTQDGTKGVVSDVSHANSQSWFILEIDDGEVVSTRRASFDGIRIANRTIQSQWKERMLVLENIVPQIRPKSLVDTSPSKQSVISTSSGKPQRELVKTGFVVTINPKNEEPIQTKDDAMRAIKRHGGLVIEDWSSVFTMEGKHSQSNKRWTATPQDFRWKLEVNLDRVFLLSDDAHQKPKFLLALALGIPCLSFEWLTREEKFSSDWQPFLLPAGYSDTLGARISQLVDLDWGNCTEHLTDIMVSRVPVKLFSQKTVLCVGADLVPLPSNRVRRNVAEEASRYVPWIILCMGAVKVEAVTDIKQVSPNHVQAFDYIIVKDRDILGTVNPGNVTVGDVNWVKECLVSSRLTPLELD